MRNIMCFIIIGLCFSGLVSVNADNNFSANNYVFQSVQAGQNIILTNENGKKIGILRVMTPELIVCFDNNNQKTGIIARQGNLAVLFDNNNKRLGVIEKFGANYVLNKTLDSNRENKDMIHVNY